MNYPYSKHEICYPEPLSVKPQRVLWFSFKKINSLKKSQADSSQTFQKNVPLCCFQACEVSDQREMCQQVKGTENRDLHWIDVLRVILQLYHSREVKMSFTELHSYPDDCTFKTK